MRIRISRRDDFTKKWTFHGYLTQQEATMAQVQEWFGGGQYIVQLMAPKQEGGEGIRDSETFRLSGVYRPPMVNVPGVTPRPPGGVTDTTGAPVSEVRRLDANGRIPEGVSVKEYMDNALLGKLLDVLESKQVAPVGPTIKWDVIVPAVTVALTGILTAIIERKPDTSQVDSLREQLAAVHKQPGPTTSAITDVVSAVRELMDLRSTITNPEGAEKPEPEPMMGLLGKVIEAVTQLRNQQPAPQAIVNQQPGPLAVPQVAISAAPWEALLRDYEGRIVDAAARGLDPVFVAEMTVTYLPEQQRGALMELLHRADTEATITRTLPALTNYPTWLTDLVAEMRVQMFGEPEEADDATAKE